MFQFRYSIDYFIINVFIFFVNIKSLIFVVKSTNLVKKEMIRNFERAPGNILSEKKRHFYVLFGHAEFFCFAKDFMV